MKRIAIVTGASSGMGREFVMQLNTFCPDLDEIWVLARRRNRLEQLALKCPVPIRIFEGDITKKKVRRSLKTALQKENPVIRILINAAGFGKTGTVEEIAAKEETAQTDMINVNCRALTGITEICLPFLHRGSRIINLASAAAFCPQPSFTVYAATKAYVLSFSRALNRELRKRGIFVTAVCPGPVNTEFFRVCGGPSSPVKKHFAKEASAVVKKALRDSLSKKEISVYGAGIKAARLGAKLLPHSLVIRLFT